MTRKNRDHWDDDELDSLVLGLMVALKEYRSLPVAGQLVAIEEIARYLRRRVPNGYLEPLESIYTELMNRAAAITADDKPGPKPAPLDVRMVVAYSAATVTILKSCGWKVGDAIAAVAERTGIDPERLRYYRDEIHRGRTDELVRKAYDLHVERVGKMTDDTPPERIVDYALRVTQFFTVGRPFIFEFSDL